jgi:hypothetical protein
MVEDCKDAAVAVVFAKELSVEPASRRCLIRNPQTAKILTLDGDSFFYLASLLSKKVGPSQEWLVSERDGVISTSCGSSGAKRMFAAWSGTTYCFDLGVADSNDVNPAQWVFTLEGQIMHRATGLYLTAGRDDFSVALEKPDDDSMHQQWQLMSILDDSKP